MTDKLCHATDRGCVCKGRDCHEVLRSVRPDASADAWCAHVAYFGVTLAAGKGGEAYDLLNEHLSQARPGSEEEVSLKLCIAQVGARGASRPLTPSRIFACGGRTDKLCASVQWLRSTSIRQRARAGCVLRPSRLSARPHRAFVVGRPVSCACARP